jgi:hypothetical protein
MSLPPTYADGTPVVLDVNGQVIPLPAPEPIPGDAPILDSFGDPPPTDPVPLP